MPVSAEEDRPAAGDPLRVLPVSDKAGVVYLDVARTVSDCVRRGFRIPQIGLHLGDRRVERAVEILDGEVRAAELAPANVHALERDELSQHRPRHPRIIERDAFHPAFLMEGVELLEPGFDPVEVRGDHARAQFLDLLRAGRDDLSFLVQHSNDARQASDWQLPCVPLPLDRVLLRIERPGLLRNGSPVRLDGRGDASRAGGRKLDLQERGIIVASNLSRREE